MSPLPMPPQDAAFLLAEAREKPLHVGGLQVFDYPQGADQSWLTEQYERAVRHSEVHPRLARRPVRGVASGGAWAWKNDQNLDLAYHVRHSALPHPYRVRELLALVSRLHGTLLDRSRPLWEMHVIEGLEGNRFAFYTKIHHALVDGVSAMRMLEHSLSVDPANTDMDPPFAPRRRPPKPSPENGGGIDPVGLARDVVGGALLGARAVTAAGTAGLKSVINAFVEEAAVLPYQAPRTMLNVPISGARRFAADRWPLARVKAVASATDSTLNDIVMAMCSGALRRYLLDHQALPDQTLVSMVPVSLHGKDEDPHGSSGNAVGVILCRLGTNLADPEDRLQMVRQSMREGKMQMEGLPPLAILLLSALSFAPVGLGPLFRFRALRKPPFNIVISNVPGPRQPLHFNGAPMTGHYPVSIPFDGQALNITVTSYADDLNFGLTGDRRSVPSLQRLLDHLDVSLTELEEVAGV